MEREIIDYPDDLNRWSSQVLQDPEAMLFKSTSGGRYIVHSKKWALLAVTDATGQRISVYDYSVDYEGGFWCRIQELII